MTVRLLTTAETGWSRATRPRQGRLWLWARNPSMCSRVSWVRLRTSGWAAERYSENTIRLSARRPTVAGRSVAATVVR